MSTLSAVIDDLFEADAVSDGEFWDFVRKTGWNKDQDYDRIKKMMLRTMNPESVKAMRDRFDNLYNILSRKINDEVENIGDDGYSDLLSHIIGMGKKLYNDILQDPSIAQKIIDARAYEESFSYVFPHDDDWKMNDPQHFMDQATKYLEDLSPLTTGKIQVTIHKEDVETIRDMVKRLRSVESGNFRKAVDGWDRDEYSRWGVLAGRAKSEDVDLHYGFGNLLYDVQRFAV